MASASDLDVAPRWIRWALRVVIVGLGAAQTFVAAINQSMNEDGIAYLDLGDAWLQGDWGSVVNTTWSPLYAAVLGAVVNAVEPSMAWEFPIVQLTNFCIFVAALACFEFFWLRLGQAYRGTGSESAAIMPGAVWWAVGYSLFAWSALNLVEIWAVTPDMTVMALVYLAAGLLVGMANGRRAAPEPALLGVVLGIGYLAKAVLFPLGIACIAIVTALESDAQRPAQRLFRSLLPFLVIATPLVVATSVATGHVTFSDVGRFTYLKHVNAMPYPAFEEASRSLEGRALHPPRRIFDDPDVFEFAEPIAGTYPLGSDPAYWTRGVEPRIAFGSQLNAIVSNLVRYFDLFVRQQGGTLATILLLAMVAWSSGWRPQIRSASAGVVAWAAIALVLYGLVTVLGRYVAPFVLLLVAGLLVMIRLPDGRSGRQLACAAGVVIALVQWVNIAAVNLQEAGSLVGFRPGWQDAETRATEQGPRKPPADNRAIARELRNAGLMPGDKVAFAGYGYSAFWARLARLRIVAEIRPADLAGFWSAEPQRRARILAALADAGVVAVVAEPPEPPPASLDPGWQVIGNTGYLIRGFGHPTSRVTHVDGPSAGE
jgi:hypothetical protein